MGELKSIGYLITEEGKTYELIIKDLAFFDTNIPKGGAEINLKREIKITEKKLID